MVPRTSYYCPKLTPVGPNVDNLLPSRTTIIKPLDGSRPRRIDDEWTTEPQPQDSQQWTGSTSFEEKPSYKEQLEEDEEVNQQAIKARATSMPKQPTEQEIMEHNLTHMPYRSWWPICIQGRGRSDAHPLRSSSRPIIQIDSAFLKGFENQYLSTSKPAFVSNHDGLLCQQHHRFHHGNRQNISNGSKRQ